MTVPNATLEPYKLEFTSVIKKIKDDGSIILEETWFYPVGGGQPSDTGVLVASGSEYLVKEVKKSGADIVHVLSGHDLNEGDKVIARIDEDLRFKHMRMHTAMHILCSVIERAEGTKITGNQIKADRSRLDVNLEEYDPEQISRYVNTSNEVISSSKQIKKRVANRSEVDSNPHLVKLAAGFPSHIKDVHLVEIDGVDIQPCGGTHVNNTGEIGKIVLLKTENRGKNNRRLYFTLD